MKLFSLSRFDVLLVPLSRCCHAVKDPAKGFSAARLYTVFKTALLLRIIPSNRKDIL